MSDTSETEVPAAPAGTTKLITEPTPQVYTANREVDVRSALTRGLAEYLREQEGYAVGGRALRFKKVLQQWGEPEEKAKFPSVAIYTIGEGTYDASSLTPGVNRKERVPEPDGRYVQKACEYVQDISVELWANDHRERAALVAVLEDAFIPVGYRFGFVLELPFYFNQRAVYAMKSLTYTDNEGEALQRHRKATFILEGRIPLTKIVELPGFQPRVKLEVGLGAVSAESDVIIVTTKP